LFDPLRDALLEALFASGSDMLLIPIQDVFGWRDRVNTPASVNDHNWTWRLPWTIEQLAAETPRAATARRLTRALAERYGRLSTP
jgi:4-alpha-glucanotransferase